MSGSAAIVRVVTYNTAAGNPRVRTPQRAFLELPFYAEALEGAPGAAILALQEVGTEQSRALRGHRVLQARRPGMGNALVIPARYEVLAHRRGWYPLAQLRGSLAALRRRHADWRQLGELRTWIEARLRDGETGRTFTVLTTHLSVEPALKVTQGRAIAARARAVSGPVILAGDLNVPAREPRGLDREVAGALGGLRDMASTAGIDRILAAGFDSVSSRTWHEIGLSDHAPVEATMRLAG